MYLFILVILGPHCYTWLSLTVASRGAILVPVHELTTAVVSVVAEHGL